MGRYDQAAQQSSKGVDFDLNGDLGYGVRLFANYGYTFARFDDYSEGGVDLSGNRPYYTPAHTGNAWLTKAWKSGFTASLGATYRSGMFTDNSNEFRLGGWTTFGGAASLSAWQARIQRQRGEPVQPSALLLWRRLSGPGLSRFSPQRFRDHSIPYPVARSESCIVNRTL